jgi:hypothetical protein
MLPTVFVNYRWFFQWVITNFLVVKVVAGRFAMLMCVVWQHRNNSIWSEKKETGHRLGVKAHHLWLEWNVVRCNQHNITMAGQQQQQMQWDRARNEPSLVKLSWARLDSIGIGSTRNSAWVWHELFFSSSSARLKFTNSLVQRIRLNSLSQILWF